MEYRSIHWRDDEARLKAYNSASRATGNSVVKIELEVADPFRFAMLIQELAETFKGQPKKLTPHLARPAREQSEKDDPDEPLMLTYQGEKP